MSVMKPIERYKLAFERKEADRVPFLIEMEQKGAQQAGMPWKDFMNDPKSIAYASMKAAKWYEFDIVYVLALYLYFSGWGLKFKWYDDPRVPPDHDIESYPVKEPEDYEKVEVLDPKKDGMIPQVIDAVEIISDKVKGEYPIQLYCFPSMMALYSCIADSEKRLIDIKLCPDLVHKGLRTVTDSWKEVVKAFANAGGTHFHVLDLYMQPSMVTLKQAQEFLVPYDIEVLKEARKQGLATYLSLNTPSEPYWDMIIDAGGNYMDALRATHKDFSTPLSKVDWKGSLRRWKEKYGKDFCLITGPDALTEALRYSPEQLEAHCKEIMDIMAPGGGFVLGILGDGAVEMTDWNIFGMKSAIEKYGKYR